MNSLAKFRHNSGRPSQSRRMMGNPVHPIYNSILEVVGETPLIKLAKIPADHGLLCDIYAKCEFLNPSGSNKDRIGKSMMEDAIKKGEVHPNTMFVEPSSGNTGIAIALNATLHGNGCIVVTKEKNSAEKVSTITLLGAEVIQIKDNMNEEETAAKIIADDPKNRMTLAQFENPVNPETHFETTGLELTTALDNDIDMVVMGAGTGGTISGIGKRVKQDCANCLVIAAEPDGSTMINTRGKAHPFLIEGIGGQEIPETLDKTVVDNFEVVTDEDAFLMAREMAIKEGLLCGGSSGAIMVAAIKAAKQYKFRAQQRIVVILPDGIRNYMDKFVSNQWMEALLFLDPPQHTMKWWDQPITNLNLNMRYPILDEKSTCAQAVRAMKSLDIAIVNDCKDFFIGAVSKDALRNYATNPTKFPKQNSEDLDFSSPAVDHLVKHCFTLAMNGKKGVPTIGRLARVLDIAPFVVIGKDCNDGKHFTADCVITADDVLDYIFAGSQNGHF